MEISQVYQYTALNDVYPEFGNYPWAKQILTQR